MENATPTESTSTDISTLPPAERALIVLNSSKTELKLNELRENAAEIQMVTDKVSRELAHRVGMDLRSARTTIEKTGKAARDDATKFSKAVIDEEKRLIAMVEGEEKRVLALRDAYDAQVEAERAAKAAAEQARKDEIIAKINGILNLPNELVGASSEEIMNERNALASFVPDESVFMEFTENVQQTILEVTQVLNNLYARTKAAEDAQEEIEQHRAHLAEIERAQQEKIAAERLALEEERAALAAERAELEELRAMKAAQQLKQDQRDENMRASAMMEAVAKAPTPEAVGVDKASDADVGIDWVMPVKSISIEDAREMYPELPLDDVLEAAAPAEIAQALATAPVDFTIRQTALYTADQFEALADKVEACGVGEFAQQLRAVAYGLREGDHDAKIAAADVNALLAADDRLLNATVNAIDAMNLGEGQEAA